MGGTLGNLKTRLMVVRRAMPITSDFVQLGLDGSTIIVSTYPSFIFGGRNSVGSSSKHQLLIINLASVPGRQLVNLQTAQSLERCLLVNH